MLGSISLYNFTLTYYYFILLFSIYKYTYTRLQSLYSPWAHNFHSFLLLLCPGGYYYLHFLYLLVLHTDISIGSMYRALLHTEGFEDVLQKHCGHAWGLFLLSMVKSPLTWFIWLSGCNHGYVFQTVLGGKALFFFHISGPTRGCSSTV